MSLKSPKRLRDQTIIKVYRHGEYNKIKVIRMNSLRVSGVEDPNEYRSPKGSINDSKLSENISRARSHIFDIAFCNDWQFFFTGTLDPNKYDRSDLEKFHKDLTKWISNQNRLHHYNIKYCLIPELHSDGKSWHMHGFLSGIPDSQLQAFKIGDQMSGKMAALIRSGRQLFNWVPYSEKFGFCDLEPVLNVEAVSKYVSKYINKNLGADVASLGAHLYYHSRGLNTGEIVRKGYCLGDIDFDFSNEYCSVLWCDYSDELLDTLKASIVRYNERF